MIEKIRADLLAARKAKQTDEAALLATLLSEITMVGKNDGNRETTTAEALKVVTKFLQNIDEVITFKKKSGGDTTREEAEKAWLSRYVPAPISDDELKKAVETIVASFPEKSMKIMGAVMEALQKQYAGRYDGKKAAAVVKETLMS